MRDMRRSYYKILMVDEEADAEIISAAYRKLAMRFHPDLDASPQAARRMTELNEAYRTLRDPELRARYDREWRARRDRRSTDRLIRRAEDLMPGSAGPPVGRPMGSLIDFGTYSGWTLGQIARRDPDFLEWLARTPIGRRYRNEIEGLLRPRAS